MIESNNGESLSGTRRLALKRHTAKHCPFAIRQRIVNALANGDSKRAIARALRVSNNTITAIAEQEWQQVEARKARIAAQAEQIATKAADQLNEALDQRKLSPQSLVPVFGVAVDKLAILRGEASLTVHHEHTHSHQHELVQRFNEAMKSLRAPIEKRTHGAVVETDTVTPLAPGDASVAGENAAQKAS